MSARNPKRSSRLAAKEEIREGGDSRKKGRADDGSPIAEVAPVSSPAQPKPSVPSPSAVSRASPAAASERERRGGQQAVANVGNEGKPQSSGAPTGQNASAVADNSAPSARAHSSGVGAAFAASARKEASFNAQQHQAQQLQSNRPSGGSHTAKRAADMQAAAAAAASAAAAAAAAAAHPQVHSHQKVMPPQQPQPQQQRVMMPSMPSTHLVQTGTHATSSPQPMQPSSTPKIWQQQQTHVHHAALPGGSVPSPGYLAANGRRAHPEGVAGDAIRRPAGGDGRMMLGAEGSSQHHVMAARSPMYRPDIADPRVAGGHVHGHVVHGHHSHQSVQQQALTEELRKGLGGAVERWISARNALPGEDSARFPTEIHRLVGLIAFDACERSRGGEERVNEVGGGESSISRKEVTTTRFRLAHPEIKVPLIFEATHHIFSGKILGTGAEHRIEGLRWKVEFELIGFFILVLHTQTFDVGEDVARHKLNEVRQALNTHISSSELGVLLMLAGNACRGASAWNDVEEVCFWTANFSLPEFRVT